MCIEQLKYPTLLNFFYMYLSVLEIASYSGLDMLCIGESPSTVYSV